MKKHQVDFSFLIALKITVELKVANKITYWHVFIQSKNDITYTCITSYGKKFFVSSINIIGQCLWSAAAILERKGYSSIDIFINSIERLGLLEKCQLLHQHNQHGEKQQKYVDSRRLRMQHTSIEKYQTGRSRWCTGNHRLLNTQSPPLTENLFRQFDQMLQ